MSWLVGNTVVAAALAAVALLAARWRAAPAAVHALWLLVLLKLVTPPLFVVPVDLGWLRATPAPATPTVVDLGGVDLGILATLPPPAAAPVVAEPAHWPQRLLVVAALGSAGLLAWFAVGIWRAHRRLRRLGPVPMGLRREITALAGQLGVRVPVLRDDPAAGSPYVWAFGGTRLVVPAQRLLAAPAKGRAAVLAHELAHLRRGDHWLAHAELLLAVLLWWHPLFWFARARLRLWAELACDAWAVACVPEASLDYATVLVDAAARTDSPVPAPAVLAARPAGRTDFERRLTMILNENVPCRASRAWWLPLTALTLGLFTAPVIAQEPQEPAPVEIRVNGKAIGDLSAAERTALLEQLLRTERAASQPAQPRQTRKLVPPTAPTKTAKPKPTKVRRVPAAAAPVEVLELDEMPSGAELGKLIRDSLAEAKVEILADEDLKALGIQDGVIRLLDDLGEGKGITNLEPLLRSAMQGAKRVMVAELEADPELRELGLNQGLMQLVELIDTEPMTEGLGQMIEAATTAAIAEARAEIRGDAELRRLGITSEIEGALDALLHGKGDFGAQLQSAIEKAMRQAGSEAVEGVDEPVTPQPKAKAKRRKQVEAPLK